MPTPTFVQNAVSDTTTPVTATFTGVTVAGNTYVVTAGIDNPGVFASISDTEGGNNYILQLGPTPSPGGNVTQYVWVAQNVTGGTLNAITINTTGGGVISLCTLECSSCQYVDQAAQRGQSACNTTDCTTSPTVTTRVATELVLGLGSSKSSQGGFTQTGTGFTNIARGTQEIEYLNAVTAGSYTATSTTDLSTDSVMGILTFSNTPPPTGGAPADQVIVY